MTVKFVTHSLNTGNITVMGNVADSITVRGSKISRIGAVEGQEQENPATVHINFVASQGETDDEVLVLTMELPDAIEMGLNLLAMGIETQSSLGVDEVRDRLSQLIAELDRTLQVSR